MLHILKPFNCPNCNSSYTINKDFGRQHTQTKFPVILPCNHTVCESCLFIAVKNRSSFACSVCKAAVDLSSGNEAITKFWPDLHALGILNAIRKKSLPSIKVKMLANTEILNFNSSDILKSNFKICDSCHQVEALWQCDECQSNFCNLCYDKVHKKIKSRRKHEVKKIFAELYNTLVQTGCKEHCNKPIEFFCERDDELTCSHCMIVGKHIGHEVKTLENKNKACAEDLKNLLIDISAIEKRLKYTEHLLAEVSSSEKIDVSKYIEDVHNHFHKLHSLLVAREGALISQLENIANLQNEPFEKMVFEISGYRKEITSIKKDAESVIENPCLAISAPFLLKKLESLKDIPCYLLPIQANMDNKVTIDLQLDKDFENDLQKHGSIQYSIKPKYHLVPTQDLPENYCVDIPESFISDIETQSTSTSVDNMSEDSLMTPLATTKSGIEAAFKSRDFNKSCPEAVMVSFIKDPAHFWVQRCADSRKLNSLYDNINKWCRSRDMYTDKHIPLELGDLYLVQFSRDRKWYRGRLNRILEPGETYEVTIPPTGAAGVTKQHRIVNTDELKVEIFYIDYGNTEFVPISKLKNIQNRFLSLPAMAKQCCLVDIAPVEKNTWSHEAIDAFTKFVNQKQVIMQIYEEKNSIFYVDLSQIPDTGITNDVPVSVRDALVFLELAVFPSGNVVPSRRPSSEKKYLPPERLRLNADIPVIVSHVENPSHLYVQQISTASYLSQMIFDMSDAYCRDNNTLLHSIYAPHVGMVCAAQFSVDKQWYRAQVIGLPGGSNVKVQYVDFGNTEVIHHKYIRKLFDRFSKLNIQAIPCKLADVTYNQDQSWSPAAKEWLTKKVSKKQLSLKSMGYDLTEQKSEIIMFFVEDDYEVCVNTLLVEAGLASSCGPGSATPRKKIEITEPSVPVIETELEILPPYALIEEPHSPPVIVEPKKKPPVPELVKKFPENEGHHIEVHLSYIISPTAFYVRIAGEMEKKLENLMAEMQKAYKDFESAVEDCGIGKSYAVYSDASKKWFRGTVFSKVDDQKVKALFVDYGSEEEVPMKNVQKLLEKFTVDEEYSIRCELTGIIPAGGTPLWSHAACDAFKELVAPHEILHLAYKGEIEKDIKSLPVSLFIEEIKFGGALEPTEVIYKNIASELVSCGLALPVRKKMPKSECKTPDDCGQNKMEVSEPEKHKETIKEEPVKIVEETIKEKTDKCEVPDEKLKSPMKENIQPEIYNEPPIFRWKLAEYPADPKFRGFVTNIGDDGCIQLHVVREGGSVVEMIKKALQFKYSKSTLIPVKKPLPIGEACVAKFSLDNLWYRAEVIAVYPEKVKVNFIDYGNNEVVSWSDVRTDLIMQSFARQCIECKLAKIHTGNPGQWDDDLLNFLHSQLVETIVEVECLGLPDENGQLPCEMVTNCGVSVTELLQSMGFMESNSEPIHETKSFQKATELREGDIFPVCITQVNSPNIIYLQRLKISEPKSDNDKEYNKEHEAFLELIKELQEKAENFPSVKEPLPGLACCAKYSYDDNWYRCEITDLVEDGVVVLYVDYGNSETISSENLREPDSHIIEFPVQVLFCKIYGMSPVDSDWDPEVQKFMIQKLLKSGLEIFARVVVPGTISEVDLMFKDENGEMKLVYQELVDMNLITLKRS